MTALPLSRPQSTHEEDFERRLRGLERHYALLWRSTSSELPPERSSVGRWRRLSNSHHTRRLIDEIARRVERYPSAAAGRDRWRAELKQRIRTFGEQRFDWPSGYRDLLVADEYWSSTVEFVRAAREFAPKISPEDLFQALRNVWIINSVQMLLGLDVVCTPPAFAYSMLYPWTDNFLDSPSTSAECKRAFNRRLGERLRGVALHALDTHERQVFDLIGVIEAELPRKDCPEVYLSLEAIHRGQVGSLDQHHRGDPSVDLLAVTVRKGGSSLLPDGYLIAPRLEAAEERFLFGYGVFLQLLDDLQDVSEDLAAGHRTLFTAGAWRGPLDDLTAKLLNFIDRCLDGTGPFSGPEHGDRKDLIRRNCVALAVGAVAEQRRLYSAPFLRRLESGWPLGLRAQQRLRRFARKRFSAASAIVRRQRGTDSLVEMLCCETTPEGPGSDRTRSPSQSMSRP